MDNVRFDAVSRTLSQATTRRGALSALAGLAGLGLSEALAKRRTRDDRRDHAPDDRGRGENGDGGHGGHGAHDHGGDGNEGHGNRGGGQGGHDHGGHGGSGRTVAICHRTGSRKHPYQVIEMARSAVAAHEAHGDLVRCDDLNVLDFATCTCVCPPEATTQCQANELLDPELCRCMPRPAPVCTPACLAGERCREMTVGFGGDGSGESYEITYTTCCHYESGAEVLGCSGQPLPGGFPPTESGTASFICVETCAAPPSIPVGVGAPGLQMDRVACDQTCSEANAPCGQGGTCVFSQCCNGLICQPSCDKSRFA